MMNERIKVLEKQATTVVEGWSDESGTTRYYEFNKEKFAELIVEECNQYALRNWEHGHLLGQDLKIYFGFGDEE
jgi:hypothetical protein